MPQLKDGIDFVTGNVLSFQQMNRMKNNWYSGATAPANPVSGMVWVKNDGITYVYFGAAWNPLSTVAEFLDLTDTPAAYAGEGGKFVKVNAVPDALEFAAIVWGDVSKAGSNLTDLATRQHAGLTDITSDQHHPQLHAAAHADAQADELSHNALKDYAVGQHRVWEDSIAQDIHNDNISEGSVTQHVGAIDHDALLNTHANPYKLDDLATPDDNTDLDFSTVRHGLVPKGTDVGDFLKDDGTWAAAGGGAGDVTAAAVLVDHTIIRGDGGAKGVQDSGVVIDDTDNVTGMVTLTLPNEGLHLLDTGGNHDLIIKPGTDLGADRILTITTGDAARTITLSGNPTLADWFDQAVKVASNPTFALLTLSNIVHADADHDKFLVSDAGKVEYRTGAELRSDIGAGTSSLALGESDSTAYRGDRGKIAYDHSQDNAQAHTDYLKNNASDSTSGALSATDFFASYGAVGTPSFSFTGDTNTGMYHYTTDQIGFALGGIMRCAMKANYLEVKPSTDSYGIIIRDSGSSTYLNIKNVNGVCYFCDTTGTSASNFLSGDGAYAFANDHGTAATDQLVNVCYGTGAAPAANTTTIGALYIKYTA